MCMVCVYDYVYDEASVYWRGITNVTRLVKKTTRCAADPASGFGSYRLSAMDCMQSAARNGTKPQRVRAH